MKFTPWFEESNSHGGVEGSKLRGCVMISVKCKNSNLLGAVSAQIELKHL